VRLSQIDLNLLLVLDTVLAERSVARAAQLLHVTPSAISNSLARLRSTLGDPLVIRNGRGIVPTPRAAALAPALRRALDELEGVVRKDAFDPLTTTREFTLALADAGQIAYFPHLVSLIGREMPKARLRVVGVDTYISAGGVAGTEIDAALIGREEKAPGVHVKPLYQERSVLVVRRGSRFSGKRLGRKQLAALAHVDVQVAPGRGYRKLEQVYGVLGIERRVAVTVPNFIAAAAVVAKTQLAATLPASLVDRLGKKFGLEVVASPAPPIVTQLNLVWHERTDHDPALQAFRDAVERAVAVALNI
jgi:DNA-binding transcriptional LysR family regulator